MKLDGAVWDNEELSGRTENIRILKWLPQSDLLRHPKIKLFITQGGLQSTDEAISAGVPLIGIPMLADQWYNVQKYVYHGIGEELDFETLTEEQLTNTIYKILTNESYRHNIIRLRTLMLDQPMKPLERAIWWIEHVLRHGGAKHLRAPSANVSWSQYLELELSLHIKNERLETRQITSRNICDYNNWRASWNRVRLILRIIK
ncbi:unnamed protein product [Arctia plantaginis]|uniref:UDP-glucuronosyltransferase n=1 Tax=Arctia plantaginis TaxID=874455 RepID=A0A8S1AID3_ARCPL|nr:unnamed protein product [Arctia plantaginis]